jgi:hypothetical protein
MLIARADSGATSSRTESLTALAPGGTGINDRNY